MEKESVVYPAIDGLRGERLLARFKRAISSAFFASVLVQAVEVHAETYYVASTGNNSNTCLAAQTESTPKLTLSAGVGCLASGDTLIIKAGTYTAQEITNPPAGTEGAYTVIMGDPSGARPVLLPNRAISQRGFYCSNGSNCHHIEVRHLEVRDSNKDVQLYGSETVGYAHHIRVIDNYFYGGGVGILISSSLTGAVGGDHLIQGNTFERKGRLVPAYIPGINSIYNTGSRSIIEGNTFIHCQIGVGLWSSTSGTGSSAVWLQDVIIRNNVFRDMALPLQDTWQQGQGTPVGIHISVPGGGHRIYNNLFYRSGEQDPTRATKFHGVLIQSLSTAISIPVHVYNNTFYNFIASGTTAVTVVAAKCSTSMCFIRNNIAHQTGGFVNGTQSNNLTTDPSFTNPAEGDFTIRNGSAAIDRGVTLAEVPKDFAGVRRPQGAGYDIGAYEAGDGSNPLPPTNVSIQR